MKVSFLKAPIGGIIGLEMITFVEPLGMECVAGGLEERGYDCQIVDCRIDGLEPVFEQRVRESTRAREAYFFDYAVAASEIAKMPLMVTGGFRSVTAMNEALRGGDVDMIGIARPLCTDPGFPARLLRGELTEAPDHEKDLRIGPGLLGPNSPLPIIKATNGFARVGWYYEQLYRLADGYEADLSMSALRALISYEKTEKRKARELKR